VCDGEIAAAVDVVDVDVGVAGIDYVGVVVGGGLRLLVLLVFMDVVMILI